MTARSMRQRCCGTPSARRLCRKRCAPPASEDASGSRLVVLEPSGRISVLKSGKG